MFCWTALHKEPFLLTATEQLWVTLAESQTVEEELARVEAELAAVSRAPLQ
jgi:hypothetical protein